MDDTISRQAVVDLLDEYMSRLHIHISTLNDTESYSYARGLLVGVSNNIKQLPSAQPEQRWIPVSERLPEKGFILVTYKDGDVDLLQQPTAYRRYDIIAWMPLPEPYKEEKK